MMQKPICYTIGHSNHPIDAFLKHLKDHNIQKVVDIRRKPYSSFAPQYQKKSLQKMLHHQGIIYVFLGKKLGGFKRVPPDEWTSGIHELIHHIQLEKANYSDYNTTILCSEGDPSKCHRAFLVAPSLMDNNIQVVHILPNSNLLCHLELEELLLNKYFPERHQLSIFDQCTREELLQKAYFKRRKDSSGLK